MRHVLHQSASKSSRAVERLHKVAEDVSNISRLQFDVVLTLLLCVSWKSANVSVCRSPRDDKRMLTVLTKTISPLLVSTEIKRWAQEIASDGRRMKWRH